eukprot:6393300-Prymnesium_polylepis.1
MCPNYSRNEPRSVDPGGRGRRDGRVSPARKEPGRRGNPRGESVYRQAPGSWHPPGHPASLGTGRE